MMHSTRRYVVVDVAESHELALKLTQQTWCPCNGFRLADLIFLNDSTSPDGAQEYAVFRNGRQIESITFSWCTTEEAHRYIVGLLNGDGIEMRATLPTIQTPAQHGTCRHCA
jgi:hypothetical protein